MIIMPTQNTNEVEIQKVVPIELSKQKKTEISWKAIILC